MLVGSGEGVAHSSKRFDRGFKKLFELFIWLQANEQMASRLRRITVICIPLCSSGFLFMHLS